MCTETIIFLCVMAMLFGTTLDTNQPRVNSTPLDVHLLETLPPTGIALVLLLMVT